MKRTFIAIKIDPGDRLRGLISELKEGFSRSRIKWVETENIHITLAFLGDTSESDIEKIKQILDLVSKAHLSFQLIFQSIDLFKSLKDPRVIFLGMQASDDLFNLRQDICKRLRAEGLYSNNRTFKPHLTLGRPKYIEEKNALPEIISKYRDITIQSATIGEVTFYESILKQNGPVYKVIGNYKLALTKFPE